MQTETRTQLLEDINHRFQDDLEGVFLVGSQARGEAKPYSDIDLLVLTRSSEQSFCTFVRGELAVVQTYPMGAFLTQLYAPEGKKQLLNWFILAGMLDTAIGWHDPNGVIPAARGIITDRHPIVDLHSRIYWDEQIGQMDYRLEQLEVAEPYSHSYYFALSRFLRDAVDTLILYNGRILHSVDLAAMKQPAGFSTDWPTLWCLGADPEHIDLDQTLATIGQIAKGIWLSVKDRAADLNGLSYVTRREDVLSRLPGNGMDLMLSQESIEMIPLEDVDQLLRILWDATKFFVMKDRVMLVTKADQLVETLFMMNIHQNDQLLPLLHNLRVPPGADPLKTTMLATRLLDRLKALNQVTVPVKKSKRIP